MATSVAAYGRIRVAQRRGEAIPADWALAPDGSATTDPAEAMHGALLPVGGSKGSALALMVEMLAGVLAGAGIARNVGNPNDKSADAADVGHTFIALDVAAFMSREEFDRRASELGEMVRGSRPAADFDAVRLPGGGSTERREQARKLGVDVADDTAEALQRELHAIGLDLPPPVSSGII
jgi:LDH2 family malate/lactate/ureidoglycolate dehydrogenase